MPGLISVAEFVDETREDFNSPTTSTFVSRMPQCRQTVANLEETLDFDRDGLTKMRKAIKAIYNSGNSHVNNEMYFSRVLERLGGNALNKDQEPDIAAAFLKFAVVTKELSALMKTLMQNINNIVMFPLESLLKGDLRGVKGDLKRPFERACKEYEAKYAKIEKEKKQQAKEAGLIRTEVTSAEIADDMEKERRLFQLQMCEYLIKVNEIKTKKGIELLQHLVEYYHAQTNYFQDGLKTIEHFGSYVADLSIKLQRVRQKQDEERRNLTELRSLLSNSPGLDKEVTSGGLGSEKGGYSLHQPQGDKAAGLSRSGYLLKKSEGKMRRVWQKRKCTVLADGFLDICHADESKPPTRVSLLTCQIKMVPDDKRAFDLISYNRTYHLQAEDEGEQHAWMSVLVNCKESALVRALEDSRGSGLPSLLELSQAIIRQVQRLPSNERCVDCSSTNDNTWLCINFGVVMCIECSGIHRDLGVHISRIQSLTLDHIGTSQLLIARHMSNQGFNQVMEAALNHSSANKPSPSSTMEERYEYIRAKYVDRKFAVETCSDEHERLSDLEHAVNNRNLYHLLQVWAEKVDLSAPLPTSDCGETALHLAVTREMGSSLHIVDFLVQNMSTSQLDKQTSVQPDGSGGNSALHMCAVQDKTECMKLLLRSGADPTLPNAQDKTPLDLAHERGHRTSEELLRHALQRQKSLFEHINTDWNLSHDDGSTDFSDDDTVIEDRNGCITPERKSLSSRPSSYTESPVNMRSRSSTCDSIKSGSMRVPAGHHPPIAKKPYYPVSSTGSLLKKRAAPLPPAGGVGGGGGGGAIPTIGVQQQQQQQRVSIAAAAAAVGAASAQPGGVHSRSPSDPNPHHTLSKHHKRSPSSDSRPPHLAGAKLVIPPGEIPILKSTGIDKTGVERPRVPPPPAPPSRLSNGQSTESIASIVSDSSELNPIPPPRKLSGWTERVGIGTGGGGLPRCKALYDCSADNEDELSFREGDIILVTNACTDDDNWMEGALEREPTLRGMFPVSFVHMLPEP